MCRANSRAASGDVIQRVERPDGSASGSGEQLELRDATCAVAAIGGAIGLPLGVASEDSGFVPGEACLIGSTATGAGTGLLIGALPPATCGRRPGCPHDRADERFMPG